MSLPSFLSPLARVAVGTLPPLGGAPTALMFTMETQQQSNWCWAAAATSIFKFYSNSNQWSQCSVAGSCLSQSCCTNPGPCNQPFYLDSALNVTGNLATTITSSDSYANVQVEINANKPIGCHISCNGGGGHFVAIYGYDAATQDIEIGDPWYGPSIIPYNTFLNNYQGSGVWDFTYRTT